MREILLTENDEINDDIADSKNSDLAGLLIQSGVNRNNHELLSELWDISQSHPIYRATMFLQCFKHLLQFIRFYDRQHRDKSDCLFYFSGPYMLLSYQAKENKIPIILLLSLHKVSETFGGENKLPCAVHDYNQTKCRVVATDQCIGSCTVRRINRRWPMTVFYNLIDIAAINALTI
ncbi:unnamed protein product [Rotaria socialis]|uniref:PiggyBac transposable element-derived protein domain-containing protein n=1 Tax=Rotaria socialis TaxID=392032 RepID=A0A818V4M1_9BILA|nr:unnamed protein product [Rotaria socialis]